MDKHKADLLTQLKTMTDYVDQHFDEIPEKDARSATVIIHGAWQFVERRKGERRA